MCQLFAHQPQRDYESQTRSLRIGGHCTSIRLEMSFWDTLEEIAGKEGLSVAKFLTKLHTEVLDHHGAVNLEPVLTRVDRFDHTRIGAAQAVAQNVDVGDSHPARQVRDDSLHRRVEIASVLIEIAGDALHPGIIHGGTGGRFDLERNAPVGGTAAPIGTPDQGRAVAARYDDIDS